MSYRLAGLSLFDCGSSAGIDGHFVRSDLVSKWNLLSRNPKLGDLEGSLLEWREFAADAVRSLFPSSGSEEVQRKVKISQIKSAGKFVDAAIACIASLPDDEVLSMQELSERLGRALPSNGHTYNKLRPYGCMVNIGRPAFVYGNPKALRALRKKLSL
jgi:hypothetical protein